MTPPAKAGSREWTGLVVIALPCLVYAMDLTVLNLALPALSADLQPSSSELLWIVDVDGFLVAGLLITMGTLCDRIGRRRLLLIGGTAFGVASLVAALSTSAEMLLATRALLGVVGATLAPSTLSLIRTVFHDPRERTFAIDGWITSFSAGAARGGEPMLSPITDALARREVDMNEHSAGHTFLLNGAALYYEERGQGAPVVLVHGGLGSSAQWEPVARELADGFRVITPDSRGHGRSTNPSGRLSYPGIAADLAALIVALELHHPVVGGWSDGGQAALELGARHPDAAGALIIGAAHPDFTASGLRDAHRALLAVDDTGTPNLEGLDAQLGELAEEIKSSHPGGSRQWRELVRQTAPMWLDYAGLAPHELQAIHAPALVLAGDRDELVPLDLTLSLYRALPDAELAVCPHVDHAGPTPERAPVVASLIRDFAQRHTTT